MAFEAVNDESLFQRLGGESAVSAVVDDFYDLVQQDERVNRFFQGVDMEKTTSHQKEFLKFAFGGSEEYSGKSLHEAHSELSLSADNFDAIVEDLVIVLTNVGVGTQLIEEVTGVLNGVKGDIVTGKSSGATVVYDLEHEHCELLRRQLQWVVQAVGSLDEAGNIIYEALFNGAGEGKKLFVSPKKATAFRFISQIQRFVEGCDDVTYLDDELYNMGMRHIAYISPAQCKQYMPLFINTITNVIKGVLDEEWDDFSAEAWLKLLSYVGGMLLRNLSEFTGKVHLIRKSWESITNIVTTHGTKNETKAEDEGDEEDLNESMAAQATGKGTINFGESLYFNLGVMSPEIAALFKRPKDLLAPLFGDGFGQLTVLISDPMLLNEELYILGIRHLKYGTTREHFPVFGQAVMVTLRSMLPRDWNWAHEDAWGWLWETCSTYLCTTIEQGHINKQLIDETMDRLGDTNTVKLGSICTERLFSLSDDVQNYFYKPNTMVAYILQKVLVILSMLSHEPISISNEIRALGMRHIKYNIPPPHFPLFGKSLVFTFSTVLEGYWTDEIENSWMSVFGFVMRCMTRAVNEGTNLVTKAMVNNSVDEMEDVLQQAPRSMRDIWLLEVNVSGEILSPFYWAVYDGKVRLAEFMLGDLLAIRADREKYYCGTQRLFVTHPGVVKNLALLCPNLLLVLFDGLLWRSRVTSNGYRKVNYFIRHLYGDPTTARYFNPYHTPLAELVRLHYPELFMHPVTQFIIDLKWSTYVRKEFIFGQAYYFVIFVLFMVGYVGFDITTEHPEGVAFYVRIVLAIFNLLILLALQIPRLVQEIQRQQTVTFGVGLLHVAIPVSLMSPLNVARLVVSLLLVVSFCSDRKILGTALDNATTDSIFSWATSISAVLLWTLPFDTFSLNITLALFKLRMFYLMNDLVIALSFIACLTVGFGCAMVISNTDSSHTDVDFQHAHESIAYLFAAFSGNYVFEPQYMSESMELFFLVFGALVSLLLLILMPALFTSTTFLQNANVEGLTYLSRAQIIVATETVLSLEKRKDFWNANRFDDRIEFDEGDLGLNGGIQVSELLGNTANDGRPADQIQRFPGEASPKLPWPSSHLVAASVDDKLLVLEGTFVRILKMIRNISKKTAKKGDEASEVEKSNASCLSEISN